ncbi:Oxygen sensor protein DosP [compost metagenome]
MAHSLGLAVVAEGVEEPAQLEFLRAHDCDEIQGYLISRPVEAPALATLLREQRREACALA